MLALLLAAGAFATGEVTPPVGDVDLPANQTAVLAQGAVSGGTGTGLPLNAITWGRPFDPSDRAPYAYDFASLFAEGEVIGEIVRLTVSAQAAALGIEIDTDTDRLPVLDTGRKKVMIWPRVASAFQGNAAFAAGGVLVGFSILVETTAEPSRFYERTAILQVRQQ